MRTVPLPWSERDMCAAGCGNPRHRLVDWRHVLWCGEGSTDEMPPIPLCADCEELTYQLRLRFNWCAADALWVRHDELCRGACGRRMDGWFGPV